MRFADIQHQERAHAVIRRGLASKRVHHAFLFTGPEGVGKEMTAAALANTLLCEDDARHSDAEPCMDCIGCRLFAAQTHPDFHLIHRGLHKHHPDRTVRTSRGLYLVVDVIRHFLIEPANTTPNRGRRRVFIIRDAERMNEGAQNALLKTLEEPPASVCLILVTTSADRLLPTIRSRCQQVRFDLLPRGFVERSLRERCGLDAGEARALARLSGGELGTAMYWQRIELLAALPPLVELLQPNRLNDPEAFGKQIVELATQLAQRAGQIGGDSDGEMEDGAEDPSASRSGSKSVPTDQFRDAAKLILRLTAGCYRDALLHAHGCGELACLPSAGDAIGSMAAGQSAARLEEAIQAVAFAEQMLDRNVQGQLVAERLCGALNGDLVTY